MNDELAPVGDEPASAPSVASTRPGGAAVGAWLLLVGACIFLGGVVGAAAAIVVAAVHLAGLPRRSIGGLGVLALVVAPVWVVAAGLPTSATVSPAFVSDSLLPHQLTFVGLALVSVWAVGDSVAGLRSHRLGGDHPRPAPARPLLGRWAGPAVVAVVAVGAVAASVAVVLS